MKFRAQFKSPFVRIPLQPDRLSLAEELNEVCALLSVIVEDLGADVRVSPCPSASAAAGASKRAGAGGFDERLDSLPQPSWILMTSRYNR